MKNSVLTILIFLGLLISFHAYAGEETIKDKRTGENIRNAGMLVTDQYYDTAVSGFTTLSNRVVVKLFHTDLEKIERAYDWELKVFYTIKLKTPSGVSRSQSDSLIIFGEEEDNGINRNIDMVSYSGDNYAQLSVDSVSFQDVESNPAVDIDTIPNDIHLEVAMISERIYNFNTSSVPVVYDASYSSNLNTLDLSWDFTQGAEWYDLEWVYVGDGSESGNHQSSSIPYNFENATRVTITGNSYSIPLSFPKGSVIYRIRGLGLNLQRTNFKDYPVYGAWSYSPSTKTIYQANSDHSSAKCYYYYTGIDTDKNWTYTSTFSEDGKRKEVAAYFDGSGRQRQMVTVMNTDSFAVVGENKYDHIGRAAVKILPAPVESEGIRFYTNGASPFNGSWDKNNFDTDDHLDETYGSITPEPLPSGSLTEKYYSSNNSLSFINKDALPKANGFPYSQTQFLNDGTNRPMAQTGVGEELNFKNRNITRYIYGNPTQTDLDRLFGNEVGYARFYQKNIILDPNGQQSIQYLDNKGRIIATALAGDSPSPYLEVDDKEEDTFTSVLFNGQKNWNSEGDILENFTFLATTPDLIGITYILDDYGISNCYDSASASGLDGPAKFHFDVDIRVHNATTGALILKDSIVDSHKGGRYRQFTPQIDSYTITRKLSLNLDHKEVYMERQDSIVDYYRTSGNNCTPQYVVSADTLCGTTNCDTACLGAFSYLLDGARFYLDSAGKVYEPNSSGLYFTASDSSTTWTESDTTSPFNVAIEECIKLCEDRHDSTNGGFDVAIGQQCDIKYNMMLADMSPGGQYLDNTPADYIVDSLGFVTYVPEDYYVIHTIDGPNACSEYIPVYDFGDSTIIDTLWIGCDTVFLDKSSDLPTSCLDSLNVSEGTNYADWEELMENWQPHYAALLVECHPEYCAYDFYCSYSFSCGGSTYNMDDVYTYDGVLFNADDSAYAKSNPGNYDLLNPYLQSDNSAIAGVMNDKSNYIMEGSTTGKLTDPLLCSSAPNSSLPGFAYDSISLKLQQFIPIVNSSGTYTGGYYSIWYLMDDPEGIAASNGGNTGTLDTNVIRIFDIIHGDGNCLPGIIRSGDDKFTFFRSTYYFLRQKYMHDYLATTYTCSDSQPYNYWDADTNFDGVMDSARYNLIFPKNPLYQLFDDPDNTSLINTFKDGVSGVDMMPATTLDTCSCDLFGDYLTANSLSFSSSSAVIASALNNEFCSNYTVSQVDSFKLCNSSDYFGTMNLLPDSLTCQPENQFLNDLNDLCSGKLAELAKDNAEQLYQQEKAVYLDSVSRAYDSLALAGLSQNESVQLAYTLGEYHYTLYYYDQAGNLVKTIPPAGVEPLSDSTTIYSVSQYRNGQGGSLVRPGHEYVTNYKYNSLNQVIEQTTPDSDTVRFVYDREGRIIASKYDSETSIAYTFYDGLGRIAETGNFIPDGPGSFEETVNDTTLKTLAAQWGRSEVRFYIYDQGLYDIYGTGPSQYQIDSAFGSWGQRYLRNRVASVFCHDYINGGVEIYTYNNEVLDTIPSEYLDYDNATHYSYDPHGNVQTLVQEFPQLEDFGRRFFSMYYQYDLISGNVNEVAYQPGLPDQFYHRYSYDADNRIREVQTSRDDLIWEKEARYFYYPHGPLSRVELGDMAVQGLDYYYSLQGWLKGVNGTSLGKSRPAGEHDLGADALESTSLNRTFAPDAYGFGLDYFNSDYDGLGDDHFIASITGGYNYTGLYNGNIGRMTTALRDQNEDVVPVAVNNYRYDQLNRLTTFQAYRDTLLDKFNSSTGLYDLGYSSGYAYDPNGNILKLMREANGSLMDSMTYVYDVAQTGGAQKTNQLIAVNDDPVISSNFANDIDNQSGINYFYDQRGRLSKDIDEGIGSAGSLGLIWTYSNKVRKVFKNNPSDDDFEFLYNGSDERISKIVKPDHQDPTTWTSTFYVRDAQGNPMATYERDYENSEYRLHLKELNIYGSDRLGVLDTSVRIIPDFQTSTFTPFSADRSYLVYSGHSPSETKYEDELVSYVNTTTTLTALADSIYLGGTLTPESGVYIIDGTNYIIPPEASFTFSFNGTLGYSCWGPMFINSSQTVTLEDDDTLTYRQEDLRSYRTVGHKHYELKNYLGNVLSTVSDRKIWTNVNGISYPYHSESFSPGANESSIGLDLEEWIRVGEAQLTLDESLIVETRNSEEGTLRTIASGETCYSRYCITFGEMDGPVTFSLYSTTSATFIVSNYTIESPGTYCWSLGEYGADALKITVMGGEEEGAFVIQGEELYYTDPSPWVASGEYCLTVGSLGITMPWYGTAGSLRRTQTLSGCSDYVWCVSIPDYQGTVEVKLYEISAIPGNLLLTDTISQTGSHCYSINGVSGSGVYVLSVGLPSGSNGDYFTLQSSSITQICSESRQVANVESSQDYYPFGMTMPGRTFNGGDHRYGFNGMEKDDEIKGDNNSLDFGARIYDPRLGRWLSVDASFDKYPGWSPYNFALNSPMAIVDPDGKEPNRAQSTTVSGFIGYLRQQKLTTMNDIYKHVKANSTSVPRYIYTKNEGWMDMNHLFNVFENGKILADGLEPAVGSPTMRKLFFSENSAKSYYSYEDLPSNRVGAEMIFEMALTNEEELEGEELYKFLEEQLNNRGATTPEEAPNYEQIPAKRDRDVVLNEDGVVQELTDQQLSSGKYVPQNHTDEPYELTDFPAADDSLEKTNSQSD
ncbi:MAG: RHS repeat-associated core domain-containing protein [Owenweeksia sp.]